VFIGFDYLLSVHVNWISISVLYDCYLWVLFISVLRFLIDMEVFASVRSVQVCVSSFIYFNFILFLMLFHPFVSLVLYVLF
jgi:hypothetical protein